MKYRIILNLALMLSTDVRSEDAEHENKKRSFEHIGGAKLISKHIEIIKELPIVKYENIPVPVPHPVGVPVHVPINVPEPVPVEVPVPFVIYKTVQVPVEKPVPVPVEKPYPVEIIEEVPVEVLEPVPVHVPVYKTKHIYHTVAKPIIKHGWW